MTDQTKKTAIAKKPEGELDPQRKGNEMAASEAEGEVQGRWLYEIRVYCPTCKSHRVVPLDFKGQWFTCGKCGRPYEVWYE